MNAPTPLRDTLPRTGRPIMPAAADDIRGDASEPASKLAKRLRKAPWVARERAHG